jgi:hypothetical protein
MSYAGGLPIVVELDVLIGCNAAACLMHCHMRAGLCPITAHLWIWLPEDEKALRTPNIIKYCPVPYTGKASALTSSVPLRVGKAHVLNSANGVFV